MSAQATTAALLTTPLGDAAHAHLRGHSQALALLETIRADVAHPDALSLAVEALTSQPAALRGLCRTVQKHLEAGVRSGAAESGRGS